MFFFVCIPTRNDNVLSFKNISKYIFLNLSFHGKNYAYLFYHGDKTVWKQQISCFSKNYNVIQHETDSYLESWYPATTIILFLKYRSSIYLHGTNQRVEQLLHDTHYPFSMILSTI